MFFNVVHIVCMLHFPAVSDSKRVDQMTNHLNGSANGENIGKHL